MERLTRPRPRGGVAQWSNHLRLTAALYEPLWRRRSVAILTRGAFDTARELEALQRRLALRPGDEVVDLGCSAGLYARTLAARGAVATAVDVSEPFLRVGRTLAAQEGVAVSFVPADVHDLPFPDERFDAAACGGSLNEFADPALALREAARVLRPAAPLWLMYVARAEGARGRVLQALLRLGGLRFPAPAQVDAWAAEAGLAHERTERRGPLAFATYRRGAGLAPLEASSPSPGWDRPPIRRKRHNWERHGGERAAPTRASGDDDAS